MAETIELFGATIGGASVDASAFQSSATACTDAATGIDANTGRGEVDPGIEQIASSAGELARALGSSAPTEQVGQQGGEVQNQVEQNAHALQDRVEEARSTVTGVVADIERAVKSWGNAHDEASTRQAVHDTATAGKSLGDALVVL